MKTREQRRQLEAQLLDYHLTDPEWDDRFNGFNPELDMDRYRAVTYQLAYAQLPEVPPSPEEVAMAAEVKAQLQTALQRLKPRERRVITKRFGLDGREPRSCEIIGLMFTKRSVSRERIRQIEGKALRKLRHPARRKRLADAWGDAPL